MSKKTSPRDLTKLERKAVTGGVQQTKPKGPARPRPVDPPAGSGD